LEDPKVWDDNKKSQELGKEKRALELVVNNLQSVESILNYSRELFEMARE
jgi:peptide chain release factor 2